MFSPPSSSSSKDMYRARKSRNRGRTTRRKRLIPIGVFGIGNVRAIWPGSRAERGTPRTTKEGDRSHSLSPGRRLRPAPGTATSGVWRRGGSVEYPED
eukprot:3211621-Heterocapsa_arctica.AAC.1